MGALPALVRFTSFSDWTEVGGVTIADDATCGAPRQQATGDETNDMAWIAQTEATKLTSTTYTVHILASWTADGVLFAQQLNSTTGGADRGTFHISSSGSGKIVARCLNTSDTNAVVSQSGTTFNDGVERFITIVCRAADDLDILVNGVEVSYVGGAQDSVSGTGANGINTNDIDYSVLDFEKGSNSHDFSDGTVRAMTVVNSAQSLADIQIENTNALACQIFPSGISGSRVAFKSPMFEPLWMRAKKLRFK